MKRNLRGFAAAGSLFLAMFAAEAAFAQKQGGILKMYSPDSPASMSVHEEATFVAEGPMMGVFNIWSCSTSIQSKTASARLFPTSPPAGHGTRMGPT